MYLFISTILFLILSKSSGQCPVEYVLESGSELLDEAIERHNFWRTMLAQGRIPGQPKAANMMRLIWDGNLLRRAQEVSDTCTMVPVNVKDSRWPFVGVNLFVSSHQKWNPGANWTEAIDSWFSEVDDFAFPNQSPTGRQTGHYTQLVWASSFALGCGYTAWLNWNGWYTKLYVCNYGPGGNRPGQAPYVTGMGCENLCDL